MAACFSGGGQKSVTLVETTPDGGRKILISGGGRCNILPSISMSQRFETSSSPNTLRNMLKSWPLDQQRSYFEGLLGTDLVLEEETGKLFPASNKARDVRDALVKRCRDQNVDSRFGVRVKSVERADGFWRTTFGDGKWHDSESVIIATGGLSVPKTGSDGFGLALARSLGVSVIDPYPALTPLTHSGQMHRDLAGLSLDVALSVTGERFVAVGGFLFTHRGFSGPSVLDVSHWVTRPSESKPMITVNWHPDWGREEWNGCFTGSRGLVRTALRSRLPNRLADSLMAESGVPLDADLSQLKKADRVRLVTALTEYPLNWNGDEGYKKAEVTGGGVALDQVDPRTMECRNVPGLYFCGEVLDAFGPIGGHNFQWAWATGRAAGLGASR